MTPQTCDILHVFPTGNGHMMFSLAFPIGNSIGRVEMTTRDTLRQAAETRVIRVRLRTEDVERLRAIAHAERRPPQDQAAYILEQALQAYEGRSEDER